MLHYWLANFGLREFAHDLHIITMGASYEVRRPHSANQSGQYGKKLAGTCLPTLQCQWLICRRGIVVVTIAEAVQCDVRVQACCSRVTFERGGPALMIAGRHSG